MPESSWRSGVQKQAGSSLFMSSNKKVELFEGAGVSEPVAEDNVQLASSFALSVLPTESRSVKREAIRQLTRSVVKAEGLRFAVVVARFNEVVTKLLLEGALDTFKKHSVNEEDIDSLERAKDGAATMEWSRNGAMISGNEVAKGCEHGKGAARGSEHGIGGSDNTVARHEEEVSRVNEGLSRLPMSEQKDVAWLMSLLDGLSMPTSSVGTNEEVKITSELKWMKFRECSNDEVDCSQRVC